MAAPMPIHPALKVQPIIALGISRVSLLRQVGNYSIEAQQNRIRDLEQKYGFQIPEGYLLDDEGYSGTNMNRPAIRTALRMVKAGEAQAVVFPYLDRFSRNLEFGLTMIRKFREAGALVLFGEIGWVDDTPQCKMLLNMLLTIAEMQRDSIADKSRAGVAQKIKNGLAHGGRSPFGYHFVTAVEIAAAALNRGEKVPEGKPANTHQPVPEDLGTLNLMARLVLDGESAKGICRELFRRGIKSPAGKPRWNPTTVGKVLRDLCYSTGIWYYGRREAVAVAPEKMRKPHIERHSLKTSAKMRPASQWLRQELPGGPVWTPEYQQNVIDALERNRVIRVGAPAAADGLEAQLKGLMVCKRVLPSGGICGMAVVPRQQIRVNGLRTYQVGWYHCSNRDRVEGQHLCSTHHARTQDVDQAIWDGLRYAILEDLNRLVAVYRAEMTSTVDAGDLERLKADEARLLRKRDEAREKELYADDADDKRYYASQLSDIKGQLALLRRRISSVTQESEVVEVDIPAIQNEVRAAWRTKVPSERREFMAGLIPPKGIEWINDEEVIVTFRVPVRGVNGQHGEHLVDHYLPLKTKVRVAA